MCAGTKQGRDWPERRKNKEKIKAEEVKDRDRHMAARTNNKKTAIGWMGVTLMFDILLLLITIMRVDHQTIFLHHIICVDTASHNLSVLLLLMFLLLIGVPTYRQPCIEYGWRQRPDDCLSSTFGNTSTHQKWVLMGHENQCLESSKTAAQNNRMDAPNAAQS